MKNVTLFNLAFVSESLTAMVNVLVTFSQRRQGATVLPTTMSEIRMHYQDPNFRRLLQNVTHRTLDGMPLVFLAKKSGHTAERIYGPDLMQEVLKISPPGVSHFFYGGTKQSLPKLLAFCQQLNSQLSTAGSYAPPFRPLAATEQQLLKKLLEILQPHIIWVGLGSHKQVEWLVEWSAKLPFKVTIIGVGAAFDFLSGEKAQAPRWLRHIGLEWLFRLVSEPTRLGQRYLYYLPLITYLFIKEWWKITTKKNQYEKE